MFWTPVFSAVGMGLARILVADHPLLLVLCADPFHGARRLLQASSPGGILRFRTLRQSVNAHCKRKCDIQTGSVVNADKTPAGTWVGMQTVRHRAIPFKFTSHVCCLP